MTFLSPKTFDGFRDVIYLEPKPAANKALYRFVIKKNHPAADSFLIMETNHV